MAQRKISGVEPSELFGVDGFRAAMRVQDDMVVLVCEGELDLASAARFNEMWELCIAAGPNRFRIDVSRLSFMGSDGIRALLRVANYAEHARAPLELILNARVRRVLKAAGIEARFRRYVVSRTS